MAQVRAHMPNSRRAKQFSMFDALKGLKEALAAAEQTPEPRKLLTDTAIEELNRQISGLKKGQIITVVYYGTYEERYLQMTGAVTKIDPYWHNLQLGNTIIDFEEIYEIVVPYDNITQIT